jgi:hypothetical protein
VKGVLSDEGVDELEGIAPWPVPAFTAEANGRAKRLTTPLLERTRALLHQFDLPIPLWHDALRIAAYARNMVSQRSSGADAEAFKLFNLLRLCTSFNNGA